MTLVTRSNNPYGIESWDWEKLSWRDRIKVFFWQRGKICPSCSYVACRIRAEILGQSLQAREFKCRCSKSDSKKECWCECQYGVLTHGYSKTKYKIVR